MWFATVTGPCRHSAGTTGAKIRGDETSPGTSRIGIELSMRWLRIGRFQADSA
jgi:hypothetical protein